MLRPQTGGIRCGAVLLLAALSAGCVSPAKIGSVDFDSAQQPPAEPVEVAARPLSPAPPPAHSFTATQVREALPPLPATQTPQSQPGEPSSPLATLPHIKTLQQISLDISPPAGGKDMVERIAPPTNYAAEALPLLAHQHPFVRGELIDALGYDIEPVPDGLEICYQPLYFQELNAERYGRSWGVLQPAVSAANFYGRLPLVPYMLFSRPARRCTYHAHWELPGYHIPRREKNPLVISPAGGAAQTAALFGVILLIP